MIVVALLCLSCHVHGAAGDYVPVIPFETSPSWYGLAQGSINCCFGDFNDDDRPDLLIRTFESVIDFYFSSETGMPIEPGHRFSSSCCPNPSDILADDLAGDGFADLIICAYDLNEQHHRYYLFENTDGIPEAEPVWMSPDHLSYGCAIGDIDGDFLKDFVIADVDGPAAAYRGTSEGRFDTTPFWTSEFTEISSRAGLVDLDNDGDLDLVMTSSTIHIVIYRNTGGALETTPSWQTSYIINPRNLDFADFDRDGFVDIAMGGYQEPAAVFRNSGGVFEDTPAWTGLPGEDLQDKQFITRLKWGDFNGDGYPELIFSGYSLGTTGYGSDHLYVFYNDGGLLSDAPVWTSDTRRFWTDLECSDFNKDSMIDFCAATYDGCPEIYFNHRSECSEPGLKLSMPSRSFTSGDPCFLQAQLCNPGPKLSDMPVFVILDVFGSFYCAPGYLPIEQAPDWFTLDIYPGLSRMDVLPEFFWPDIGGAMSGLCFYGAMTDPAMTQLAGRMDIFYFGFH